MTMASANSWEIKAELISVGHAMLEAGLPARFVAEAIETAFKVEAAADLVLMWRDEDGEADLEDLVEDLQNLLDDRAKHGYADGTAIRFDDLAAIAKNVRAFKDNLRLIVEERGGVGQLAIQTGISQPSLSRFFESTSTPRRATLLKIARALGLGEVPIDATPGTAALGEVS